MSIIKIEKPWFVIFSLLVGGLLLGGCEVSDSDVTAAREDVADAQRDTEQAKIDAAENIRDKEQDLNEARHSTMRKPYEASRNDEVADKKRELDETRADETENVREKQIETAEAKQEADRLARELAAKKVRDGYLAEVNSKLEAVDQRLTDMRDRAGDLEDGTVQRQKLDTEIEVLEVKRESLDDAIDNLEAADSAEWETNKNLVEQALKQLQDSPVKGN